MTNATLSVPLAPSTPFLPRSLGRCLVSNFSYQLGRANEAVTDISLKYAQRASGDIKKQFQSG